MPSAMRQSGPRPALRHLAPANAPASRGLPAAAQRVGKEGSLPGLSPFSGREQDAVGIFLLPEIWDVCRELSQHLLLFLAVQCRSGGSWVLHRFGTHL